jgi:hypothetical protein
MNCSGLEIDHTRKLWQVCNGDTFGVRGAGCGLE